MYEPLEHYDFVDPQGLSWRPPYQTQNNSEYLQPDIVKANPQRNIDIVVPTICVLYNNNIYKLIYQQIGHVSITTLQRMVSKGHMEVLLTNLPHLEESLPIRLLNKATKIPIDTNIDVSKFTSRFMIQIDFSFLMLK